MTADIHGKTERLPDFLIVGAARSGTTSLYNYLRQHPQIFLPDVKEPSFFATSETEPHFEDARLRAMGLPVWKLNEYLRLFRAAPEDAILGGASTYYLYFKNRTIRNIRRYVPGWRDVKIIMILRDPVERALSQYSLNRSLDIEPLPLEDALGEAQSRLAENWIPGYDYIGFGLYYEQVKAYMDAFPRVKVFLFEDLRRDALRVVRDIFRFLGVDDSFAPVVGERHNHSRAPKSLLVQRTLRKPNLISSVFPLARLIPKEKRVAVVRKLANLNTKKRVKMKARTRKYLEELFREDVLRLQGLIGRDLSGWLEQGEALERPRKG
ncbi:MAG: sulfotransferase [Thermodesulfovibrionales bacterium]